MSSNPLSTLDLRNLATPKRHYATRVLKKIIRTMIIAAIVHWTDLGVQIVVLQIHV